MYHSQVYKIPEGERVSKGRPLVNFLNLAKNERVTAILPIKEFDAGRFIVQVTRRGLVKRTALDKYSSAKRSKGIRAIRFAYDDDELIWARLTDGTNSIVLGTKLGKAIHFKEEEVRPAGRVSQGVKGMSLLEGDEVVGMEVVRDQACLLVVTERGYGKRTDIEEYRLQGRGGQGIINIKVNPRNGNVAGFREVQDDDEVIVSTRTGKFIRVVSGGVSKIGRNTQGVRIIDLDKHDSVIGVTVVRKPDDDGDEADDMTDAADTGTAVIETNADTNIGTFDGDEPTSDGDVKRRPLRTNAMHGVLLLACLVFFLVVCKMYLDQYIEIRRLEEKKAQKARELSQRRSLVATLEREVQFLGLKYIKPDEVIILPVEQ